MTKLQNELQNAGIKFNIEGCYLIVGSTWVMYDEYDHVYRAYGDGGILAGEFKSEATVYSFLKKN
ncbi:hypothetical protein SAMN05192529_1318 [Arachidicoccus rhizosphaerae]|uniref:Uncharacterized protein n=1 Tax=Arachidicoccus rhizosphaerae TaxID=551991 RepID=A0A1H4CED6_9BACT|nr:hypothetical protein [Arachidicoccus rhizosphaerae]SEA58815.1 hypothetical protein SAMN05192529_1318 [Arachidicoccus rhizosphaerae]